MDSYFLQTKFDFWSNTGLYCYFWIKYLWRKNQYVSKSKPVVASKHLSSLHIQIMVGLLFLTCILCFPRQQVSWIPWEQKCLWSTHTHTHTHLQLHMNKTFQLKSRPSLNNMITETSQALKEIDQSPRKKHCHSKIPLLHPLQNTKEIHTEHWLN